MSEIINNQCPYCKKDLSYLLKTENGQIDATDALSHLIYCEQDADEGWIEI